MRRGRDAVEFYKAAFGAIEVYRVGGTDEHEAVVSQLTVGSASFWVSDESPPNGHHSPESLGGSTVRLLLEHRFEDFAASPLIRKGLVGFGRGDGERQRVENRSLVIVGVSGLHFAHFLFECPGVRGGILAVFRVSLRQRFNI